MAKREVELIIKARDEGASSLFEKVAHSAKILNLEARQSGEGAFEKLLKGGGALGLASFALEGVAKGFEAAREASEKFAHDEINASEAVALVIEKASDAIPVLSNFRQAFSTIGDGLEDGAAALLKWAGASNSVVDLVRSESSRKKEFQDLGDAIDTARKAMEREQQTAKESGKSGPELEIEKERIRDLEHQQKLQKELREAKKKIDPHDTEAINQFDQTARAAVLAAEKTHKEKLLAIGHKLNDENIKVKEELANKLHQLDVSEHQKALEEAGLTSKARIDAVAENYAKEATAALQAAEKAKRDRPSQAGLIDERFAKLNAGLAAAAEAEANRIRREQHRQEEDEARTHAQKMSEIKSKAVVQELENAGKAYEADREKAREGAAKSLEAIDKEYRDKIDRLKGSNDPEAKKKLAELQKRQQDEVAGVQREVAAQLVSLREKYANKSSDYVRPELMESSRLTGSAQTLAETQQRDFVQQSLDYLKTIAISNKEARDFVRTISEKIDGMTSVGVFNFNP